MPKDQLAAYPINVKDLSQMKFSRLRKKKIIHSKDPHKIKPVVYIDDDKKPKKRLDGFLLLKVTKNDLPHEIIRANLSSIYNLINYIIRNEHY